MLILRSGTMGKSDKESSSFQKVGISFETELLKLDSYAERKFKGNRSAAANCLLGALFQKWGVNARRKTSKLLTSSRRQESVSRIFLWESILFFEMAKRKLLRNAYKVLKRLQNLEFHIAVIYKITSVPRAILLILFLWMQKNLLE